MKRMLMVLLLVALFSSVNAAVDIRIQNVSYTDLAGTITLVIGVDIYPTWHWEINSLKGEFYIGTGLQAIITGGLVPVDPDTFPSAQYNKTISNNNGHFYFEFTEKPAAEGTTGKHFAPSVWHRILTYFFTFPKTPGATTTFSWSSLYKSFGVDAFNPILESPYPVTGSAAQMPSDLIDLSLPVQMGKTIAEYNYEQGVTLEWVTQSEQNCAGFHVLKASTPDGEFEKITAQMIPGQGTSSYMQNYSFTDPNVSWDQTYYYKIQEISTQFMDTSKTFYGPLAVTTGKAPDQFGLSQNYPNPFNPATEIAYKITEASQVTIKIYNLLGKEIKTLVNDNLPAGIYKVQWNGADEFGHDAPSGLYLYRIMAGDKSEMHRMTKMK